MMLVYRQARVFGTLARHSTAFFASGTKQAIAIGKPLDLLEQTEWCPYIGSSIREKLEKDGCSKEGDLFSILECGGCKNGKLTKKTYNNLFNYESCAGGNSPETLQ